MPSSAAQKPGRGALLAAALGVACFAGVAGWAGAGEPPPPGPDPQGVLTPGETAAIRDLLGQLASAITAGQPKALGGLLSSDLSQDERSRIVSRARGEFERLSYLRFDFILDAGQPVDRLGPDEMQIVSVPAEYEYESRAVGPGQMASRAGNSFSFHLSRSGGEWRIVSSDLFDIFTARSPEQVLGFVFVVGFLGVLAVFFWGWMALDAWMRTGRAAYGLLLLASTPIGAGVYFFSVYLRRKFVRREEN